MLESDLRRAASRCTGIQPPRSAARAAFFSLGSTGCEMDETATPSSNTTGRTALRTMPAIIVLMADAEVRPRKLTAHVKAAG